MNNKPAYVSKEGLEQMRQELDQLVNVKRSEVAARIHEAKEHGDITENAEYEDAKNEQAFVEGRIQSLSALIKNAQVIDENHSTTHVQIGSTVTLQSADGKESFQIVGSAEAAPADGKISNESPVGRALLGRKKGDEVVVTVPAGDYKYKILSHLVEASVSPVTDRPAQAYWADEIAGQVVGRQVVNDSKTPSGTVHVGSLRGVVLHDAIRRAVAQHGTEVEFRYGIEDLDPMDSQALLTPDAVQQYMGVPLAHVPAPDGSPHPNYARHFATIFLETFADLGIHPHLYWMSENYASGAMDPYIERALNRADVILEIYRTVSTVNHPAGWLPISVICENCGKIGTTAPRDWDGREVSYSCEPELVAWARGCGHRGRVSPFGGRAKMVWNVDWAARWGLVGATIEGCGKDLATAGGSRDRADAISRRVFDREPPLNIPYEFLNIGGRKMSTSRGEGAAAHEIAEILPPTLTRFLFMRHRPNKAIDFDPTGDTIPRLFDEFDRIADAVAGRPPRGELPPDPERIFALSLVDADADPKAEAARYRPPFAHLSLLLQVPGPDIMDRLAAEKGSALDDAEQNVALERIAAAQKWLEVLAPDSAKLAVHFDTLPAAAGDLTQEQQMYVKALADAAEAQSPVGGEAWQALIFDTARARELKPGEAFNAIYRAFLGRPNGPRAGWLLASLSAPFVIDRLRAAA